MEDILSTWRTFKWGFDGNESQTQTPSQPCDSHAFPPWPSYNQEAAKHCSNKLKRMLAYQSNKGLLHWCHAQMWSKNWTNLAMRYRGNWLPALPWNLVCKVIQIIQCDLMCFVQFVFSFEEDRFLSVNLQCLVLMAQADPGVFLCLLSEQEAVHTSDAWYVQNNTKSGEARVVPGPESTLLFLQSICCLAHMLPPRISLCQ